MSGRRRMRTRVRVRGGRGRGRGTHPRTQATSSPSSTSSPLPSSTPSSRGDVVHAYSARGTSTRARATGRRGGARGVTSTRGRVRMRVRVRGGRGRGRGGAGRGGRREEVDRGEGLGPARGSLRKEEEVEVEVVEEVEEEDLEVEEVEQVEEEVEQVEEEEEEEEEEQTIEEEEQPTEEEDLEAELDREVADVEEELEKTQQPTHQPTPPTPTPPTPPTQPPASSPTSLPPLNVSTLPSSIPTSPGGRSYGSESDVESVIRLSTEEILQACITAVSSRLGYTLATSSEEDTIIPVANFILQQLSSPGFAVYLDTQAAVEFTHQFLPQVVGTYMSRFLPTEQLASLTKYMKAHLDTLLFRTLQGTQQYYVHVSSSLKDARTFALQSALHKRFPLLASQGYEAFSHPPVFYVSEGSPIFSSLNRFVWDLYLTPKCFRVIPLRSKTRTQPSEDSASAAQGFLPFPSYGIDIDILEQEIERDKAAGRVPVAVLATFGADPDQPYQSDNLVAIRQICDRHGLWMHVEGSSIQLAAAPSATPFMISPFSTANSVCVEPLSWFSTSGTLAVTLLRSSKTHTHHHRHLIPPEVPLSCQQFVELFALWYQFLADGDQAVAAPKSAASPDASATFLGSPVANSHGDDAEPAPALDTTGDVLISRSIGHSLEMCDYLKTCLSTRASFPVLIGPGHDHPHVVIFQVFPANTMALPLSELNLDLNGFNQYLFTRLHYMYDRQRRRSQGEVLPSSARRKRNDSVPRSHSDQTLSSSSRPDRVEQRSSESKLVPAPDSAADKLRQFERDYDSQFDLAPLPISQIEYDNRVAFLFHPLAVRGVLGCQSAMNELGGVAGEMGGSHLFSAASHVPRAELDAAEASGVPTHSLRPLANTGPQHVGHGAVAVTRRQIDHFVALLSREFTLIERAARARREFEMVVSELAELQCIDRHNVSEFVGVGCFRFVPAFPVPKSHADALNAHLANLLSARSSLYRGVIGRDNSVCVIVQSGPSVDQPPRQLVRDIVDEILSVAQRMELPREVIEGLSQVVVQGIREAETRLRQESETAYTPDRLLRSVPLVGSVYDWLVPGGTKKRSDKEEESDGYNFDIRSQSLAHPRVRRVARSTSDDDALAAAAQQAQAEVEDERAGADEEDEA